MTSHPISVPDESAERSDEDLQSVIHETTDRLVQRSIHNRLQNQAAREADRERLERKVWRTSLFVVGALILLGVAGVLGRLAHSGSI